MELTLRCHERDLYPTCGFFIEGNCLTEWIAAIDRLGLDPLGIDVYGLPSQQANVPWGCLVMTTSEILPSDLGPLASAHMAVGRLVVPAKSKVVPELTDYDLEQLFKDNTYALHPDFGFFRLTEPLKLSDYLLSGEVRETKSLRPTDYSVASGKIRAFGVASAGLAEVQRALDSEVTRQKWEDAPLSLTEKLRLKIYTSFLTTSGDEAKMSPKGEKLQQLAAKLGLSGPDVHRQMLTDFKDLQERNKKEVDKLLGLMEKDPEAALRYAIPLDEHASARGEMRGGFMMRDLGLDFSLFDRSGRGVGRVIDLGNEHQRLRTQYQAAARQLEQAGKHEKAAYVYLKLLKDYQAAAQTLKQGKHYEKAAVVYLRYLKNEEAAADCYESGKVYGEAIRLFNKLENWEKVGDLNVLLGDSAAARTAYQRQLEKDLDKKAYVKAARLSKEKMYGLAHAQEILLRGWEEDIDAYNCLLYYLANIEDGETAWREIENIRNHRLNGRNESVFLKVLGKQYTKQDELQDRIKDMSYGLLSELLSAGKISAHEMLVFSGDDSRLRADTLRYEMGK